MKKNLIISVLALVFLWLAWVIAYFIVGNDYVLPSFTETFYAVGLLLASQEFWVAFGWTILRTVLAFLISAVLGVGLAVLARSVNFVRAFLAPVVSVLRTVPTVAIILILLLWTTPSVVPVIISLLILFPAVYAAALSALDEVESEYGDLVRVFHVSKRRTIFRLYLPLTAPYFLKQAGAIFSMGLKITVSGEVLAATYRSLGGLMQEAKIYVEMPQLIALTLLTVLLGFLLEALCILAYKFIVRWRA